MAPTTPPTPTGGGTLTLTWGGWWGPCALVHIYIYIYAAIRLNTFSGVGETQMFPGLGETIPELSGVGGGLLSGGGQPASWPARWLLAGRLPAGLCWHGNRSLAQVGLLDGCLMTRWSTSALSGLLAEFFVPFRGLSVSPIFVPSGVGSYSCCFCDAIVKKLSPWRARKRTRKISFFLPGSVSWLLTGRGPPGRPPGRQTSSRASRPSTGRLQRCLGAWPDRRPACAPTCGRAL